MYLNKLFNNKDLKKYLINLRKNNAIIGFTNGCFDLLHKGHLSLLSESRQKCDFLVHHQFITKFNTFIPFVEYYFEIYFLNRN